MDESLTLDRIDDVLGSLRSLLEDGDEDGEGESCGIFIPVPEEYAQQFPSLGDEDDSPPHITTVFLGKLTPEEEQRAVEVTRSALLEKPVHPFDVEMTDYGEFKNPEGQTIAHMVPRAAQLLQVHDLLRNALEAAGFEVSKHKHFKPHVTLKYMDGDERYDGPRPQGEWPVTGVEFWGRNKVQIPFQSEEPA